MGCYYQIRKPELKMSSFQRLKALQDINGFDWVYFSQVANRSLGGTIIRVTGEDIAEFPLAANGQGNYYGFLAGNKRTI
jgi:hypothetical protein